MYSALILVTSAAVGVLGRSIWGVCVVAIVVPRKEVTLTTMRSASGSRMTISTIRCNASRWFGGPKLVRVDGLAVRIRLCNFQ